MLSRVDDFDWLHAFEYANGVEGSVEPLLPFEKPYIEMFDREDVSIIFHIEEGENDGPDWIIGGRLYNNYYFFLSAGCSYTGWDCVGGGRAVVAETYEGLIRFGMDKGARQRFGIELEGLDY